MATIAELLSRESLMWEPHDGRLELRHGDDTLARIDGDIVILGQRRLELRDVRGQTTLYDTGRDARLATLRIVNHGTGRVGAITLPHHRVRVSKAGINPLKWVVTDDFGGPQLLTATKLFGKLKVSAGPDFDPNMDAGLAVVALALTAMEPSTSEPVPA